MSEDEKESEFNQLLDESEVSLGFPGSSEGQFSPQEEKVYNEIDRWINDSTEGTPIPITSTLPPVDPFNIAMLPEEFTPWAIDAAERMQCPVDYLAVSIMVTASSLIGRKACIKPKAHDDWQVFPNLWGCLVGRPSLMKTPAMKDSLSPLEKMQWTASEQFELALKQFEADLKFHKLKEKADEAQAKKLMASKKDADARYLLASSDDEPTTPTHKRYIVNDSTVEALGEILIENSWGLLVFRDELHGLLQSLDKQGQEGARAFYLEAYNGDSSYTFDRIARGKNLHIPALNFSMLGSIQPGKLQTYVRDAVSGGASDDGLLQRIGMLVWPDQPDTWINIDRSPDYDARKRVKEVFRVLDEFKPVNEMPRTYRFTAEAQQTFNHWRNEFENWLRSDEMIPALESHFTKYRKLVPAIALVCALVDSKSEVDQESLLKSLAWSEYLASHARRVYEAGNSLVADSAKQLIKKIKAGKLTNPFSERDVYRKGWTMLKTPLEAASAIHLLVEHNYLFEVETSPTALGGRSTSVYHIHPVVAL